MTAVLHRFSSRWSSLCCLKLLVLITLCIYSINVCQAYLMSRRISYNFKFSDPSYFASSKTKIEPLTAVQTLTLDKNKSYYGSSIYFHIDKKYMYFLTNAHLIPPKKKQKKFKISGPLIDLLEYLRKTKKQKWTDAPIYFPGKAAHKQAVKVLKINRGYDIALIATRHGLPGQEWQDVSAMIGHNTWPGYYYAYDLKFANTLDFFANTFIVGTENKSKSGQVSLHQFGVKDDESSLSYRAKSQEFITKRVYHRMIERRESCPTAFAPFCYYLHTRAYGFSGGAVFGEPPEKGPKFVGLVSHFTPLDQGIYIIPERVLYKVGMKMLIDIDEGKDQIYDDQYITDSETFRSRWPYFVMRERKQGQFQYKIPSHHSYSTKSASVVRFNEGALAGLEFSKMKNFNTVGNRWIKKSVSTCDLNFVPAGGDSSGGGGDSSGGGGDSSGGGGDSSGGGGDSSGGGPKAQDLKIKVTADGLNKSRLPGILTDISRSFFWEREVNSSFRKLLRSTQTFRGIDHTFEIQTGVKMKMGSKVRPINSVKGENILNLQELVNKYEKSKFSLGRYDFSSKYTPIDQYLTVTQKPGMGSFLVLSQGNKSTWFWDRESKEQFLNLSQISVKNNMGSISEVDVSAPIKISFTSRWGQHEIELKNKFRNTGPGLARSNGIATHKVRYKNHWGKIDSIDLGETQFTGFLIEEKKTVSRNTYYNVKLLTATKVRKTHSLVYNNDRILMAGDILIMAISFELSKKDS